MQIVVLAAANPRRPAGMFAKLVFSLALAVVAAAEPGAAVAVRGEIQSCAG